MTPARLIFVGASVLAVAAPLEAADVPDYHVWEWCETVAGALGGMSYTVLETCLDQEEAAARTLARMPAIPGEVAGWCHEIATIVTGTSGSWHVFLGCVQRELGAMKRRQ
jgi:hypothetical protein